MTVKRRDVLVGAAALTVAALTARITAGANFAVVPAPPGNFVPTGIDVLILHDGSAAALTFASEVRASDPLIRVSERALNLLTLEGFTEAGALLEGARGGALYSLLDDAATVILEVLLKAARAGRLAHTQYGRQVLLSAGL